MSNEERDINEIMSQYQSNSFNGDSILGSNTINVQTSSTQQMAKKKKKLFIFSVSQYSFTSMVLMMSLYVQSNTKEEDEQKK